MNVYFGKIAPKNKEQIDGHYYRAPKNWPGYSGLSDGDYVYMLCEGVTHLWKALPYDDAQGIRPFEVVLSSIGNCTAFLAHIKYLKLSMELAVKTLRKTKGMAFFKVDIDSSFSEEMLKDSSTYSNPNTFRKIIIRKDSASCVENTYDLQFYFDLGELKYKRPLNSDDTYFKKYHNNLEYIGGNRPKKDKVLNLIKDEANIDKEYDYNSELDLLKVYDALMVDYKKKEISDESNVTEGVIEVTSLTRFWCFKHTSDSSSEEDTRKRIEWALDNCSCKMQQEYGHEKPEKVTKNWCVAKQMRVGDYVFLRGNKKVYAFGKVCKPRVECTKILSVEKIIASKSHDGFSSDKCTDVIHFSDAEVFYEDLSDGNDGWGQRVDIEEWLGDDEDPLNAVSADLYLSKDNYLTIKELTTEAAKNFMKSWGYDMRIIDENISDMHKILDKKKNLIIQGAPGTGKTYATAALALSVIGVSDVDYSNHESVMKKYNELLVAFDEVGNVKNDGQIGFVTFHQSMDYDDFVEGVKPIVDKETKKVSYDIQPGVFKSLSNEASKLDDSSSFNEAFRKLVEKIPDADEDPFELKTKTGKIFGLTRNSRENLNLHTGEGLKRQGVLTKENVQKYLLDDSSMDYWTGYFDGVATELRKKEYGYLPKKKPSDTKYVLIIDEINRGNVSKIFGELISLLEADKRVGGDHSLSVTLPYSKESFSVPSNLYIIGTMNTTDRSVGSIDYAVRRRFAFVTLEADESKVPEGEARNLFNAVKNFLNKSKYDMDIEDLMVGHSYFMDAANLQMKWQYEILPLLMEYHKDGIISKSPLKDASDKEIVDVKKNFVKFIDAWQKKESNTPKP